MDGNYPVMSHMAALSVHIFLGIHYLNDSIVYADANRKFSLPGVFQQILTLV